MTMKAPIKKKNIYEKYQQVLEKILLGYEKE